MIEKNVLRKVLLDNRSEIEAHQIIHREISTDGFDCFVFVGARRAGKSFLLYEHMQQLLREGHSWNEMLYIKSIAVLYFNSGFMYSCKHSLYTEYWLS